MKKFLLIATISIFTIACADKKATETPDNPSVETTEVTADPQDLLSKEWQVKEVNGTNVVLDSTFTNYPFIKFTDLTTASGNLGCNRFGAKVEFTGNNGIKLFEITSTKMACGNLKIENSFKEALQNTSTYIISDNLLYFNNSENITVATLETKVNQ